MSDLASTEDGDMQSVPEDLQSISEFGERPSKKGVRKITLNGGKAKKRKQQSTKNVVVI
jgi:hypothetical protein